MFGYVYEIARRTNRVNVIVTVNEQLPYRKASLLIWTPSFSDSFAFKSSFLASWCLRVELRHRM